MPELLVFLLSKGTGEMICIGVMQYTPGKYAIKTSNGSPGKLVEKEYTKGGKGDFDSRDGTLAYCRAIIKGAKEKGFELIWSSENLVRGARSVKEFLPKMAVWFQTLYNALQEGKATDLSKLIETGTLPSPVIETDKKASFKLPDNPKIIDPKKEEIKDVKEITRFVRTPIIQWRARKPGE